MKKISFAIVIILFAAAVITIVFTNKEKGRFVFGSLLPLSGQTASYGEMMKRGQTMAVEDIMAQYGDSVNIVFFNTEHQKDIALTRLMEAYNRNVNHIIEVFGSDQVDHCLNYAADNDIFILSGVDTKTGLVSEGKGHFARIMPSDAAATEEIFRWIKEMAMEKIAIIYVNDDWGEGLLHSAVDNISESGLILLDKLDINRHQQSFASTAAKLKAINPDAVCLFIYPDDGGRFIKEANRQGIKTAFFATENFTGEDMTKTAMSSADGVRLVVPATSESNEKYKELSERYFSRFGEEPTIFALKGYDAVWVMYETLKNTDGTPEKMFEYLKSGVSFSGVTGNIAFDENGEYVPLNYQRLRYVWLNDAIQLVAE